jgi:hypothetical protein
MLKGVNGQKPTIEKAIATSDAYSAATFGWVQADISNNSDGVVTTFGILDNVDTSSFSDGDYLYLSGTTAGLATKTKTYAPVHNVTVGFVVKGGSVGAGQVFVLIKNGYELDEIHDVDLKTNTPTDRQVLTFNYSTQLWTAQDNRTSTYALSANAPSNPKIGDIWVKSDDNTVPATFDVEIYPTFLLMGA